VNDVVERPSVRPSHGNEGTIRRVAERDEVRADAVAWEAEHSARQLLVCYRSVPTADPQIRRGDHHAHHRLPHIEECDLASLVEIGENHGNSRGRPRDVSRPAPDLRQRGKLVAIGHDDEVPRLTIPRRRRPSSRLEDTIKIVLGDRPGREIAHVPA
jgi:hypothetical protein